MTANGLYAMTAFGLAEVVGAPLMGYFIDTLTTKYANFCTIIVSVLTAVVTAWNLTHLTFGPMSYLMCAMWGLQDAFIEIINYRCLGFEFESNSTPFGIFNTVQGLTIFLF